MTQFYFILAVYPNMIIVEHVPLSIELTTGKGYHQRLEYIHWNQVSAGLSKLRVVYAVGEKTPTAA
jgi:hypothetical protein